MTIKKDNKANSFEFYYSRIEYKNLLIEKTKDYKNVVNFNFGEKIYYGRVNKNFVPVLPDRQRLTLRACSKSPDVYALSFVTSKFEDLSSEYDLLNLKGVIKQNSIFRSISATSGFIDSNILFSSHLEKISKRLRSNLQVTPRILNMKEFINFIKPILLKLSVQVPVTFISFLKSKHCYSSCSGLAIDIADIKLDNDNEKIEKVLNDLNFPLVANLANKHGFLIDLFNPNRLIADLGSVAMKDSYKRLGFQNSSSLLNFGYQTQSVNSFLLFKSFLITLYNNLKSTPYTNNCGQLISPVAYTLPELSKFDSALLDFYLSIRMTEAKKKILVPKKVSNIDNLLLRTEQILCNPIDSIGSIGYKKKQQRLRR
jgi:hypothetical protein